MTSLNILKNKRLKKDRFAKEKLNKEIAYLLDIEKRHALVEFDKEIRWRLFHAPVSIEKAWQCKSAHTHNPKSEATYSHCQSRDIYNRDSWPCETLKEARALVSKEAKVAVCLMLG